MERTVPTTESEEVELYLRTYYSLLRSTADVQIRTLEEVHMGMNSLLHPTARDPEPDMSAFLYSVLRLPECISQVRLVVLGQSLDVFERGGFGNVGEWEEVTASARRRRCYFDGKDTVACFINSRSDIDDIIPLLTAYQIEWNKLHYLLKRLPPGVVAAELCSGVSGCSALAELMEIPQEDMDRLYAVWDENFDEHVERMAAGPQHFRVRLLSGSLSEYRRATHAWWDHVVNSAPDLTERPVYFISSNIHSIWNVLSAFPLQHQDELVAYLQEPGNAGLLNEWNDIQDGRSRSSPENFLYYVYRKYLQTGYGRRLLEVQQAQAAAQGMIRIRSRRSFDIEAQVIDLARLEPDWLDPRLLPGEAERVLEGLRQSQALILNIDYPLGLAAYNILTEVSENVRSVLGVYVMGKAATLNGVVGDVMIPNVVHDEHSQNTYLFANCFSASDVAPDLVYGTVMDNQKAVTVQGTFLQNKNYMDVFYREGYTDIEMESGPYLSAIFEMYRPTRHPVNEIVNLHGLPFDLGLIHYASDTPLSKGKNLGAGSLSYFGIDATYATSLAILRRVLHQEFLRLQNSRRWNR